MNQLYSRFIQILTGLVDSMKRKVIDSLLADYNRFKNERKTHN